MLSVTTFLFLLLADKFVWAVILHVHHPYIQITTMPYGIAKQGGHWALRK